jgi:hypothetical protein
MPTKPPNFTIRMPPSPASQELKNEQKQTDMLVAATPMAVLHTLPGPGGFEPEEADYRIPGHGRARYGPDRAEAEYRRRFGSY